MAKKKTSIVPRFEVLIILVFFMSFIFWAVPKCTSTKQAYQARDAEENLVNELLDSLELLEEQQALQEKVRENTQAEINSEINTPTVGTSILYITIDGMNIRTAPTLKSKVIDRLNLYDEVVFMNEVTPSADTISLGKTQAVEPWVKVRTSKGKLGWVFGAGVHYYKKKFPGLE